MGNPRTDSGTRPQKKRAKSQKQVNREMDQLVNEEQLYYDELADYYDKVTDARDQPTQRKTRKTRKTTPTKSPKEKARTQTQFNLEMDRVVQLNYDELDDESRDLLHKQRDKFNEPHRRANMNEARKQHKLALDQKQRDNRTAEETKRRNMVYPKQWRSNMTDEQRQAVNKAACERRRVRKDPSRNDGRGVSYKDHL